MPYKVLDSIERKTGVKAGTAQRIWQRAKEKAESEDLYELLAVLEHSEGAGRPSRVVDGTLESAGIKSILYEERKSTFEDAAQKHGINLHCRQLENIAHDHRDPWPDRKIVRGAQQIKQFLTPDNMERRFEYSQW